MLASRPGFLNALSPDVPTDSWVFLWSSLFPGLVYGCGREVCALLLLLCDAATRGRGRCL